jgi:cell division protein FtsZ
MQPAEQQPLAAPTMHAAPIAQEPVSYEAPAPQHETAIEDVTIRPIAPKMSTFIEPVIDESHLAPPPAAMQHEPQQPFIPPQAERPVMRAPRMPRIEDLPQPAQAQIRAQQGRGEAPSPEKKRMSLLERIASVGLGRKEEDEPVRQAAAPAAPPMPKAPPMPTAQRAPEPRGHDAVSEYAKRPAAPRPAPQGLDQHGRPAPVQPHSMDDELEIPAFLRRQG